MGKPEAARLAPALNISTSSDKPSFSFGEGTDYADKSEYTTKALVFSITDVTFEREAGFEGADRWSVTIHAQDGREPQLMTFGTNPKRNDLMEALMAHIAAHGPVDATLVKSGNAYYFKNVH
jgi:hypothetical protein